MQPTAERLARGRVEPPAIDAATRRPFWIVSSQVERLFRSGAITVDGYVAAMVFRRAYERGCPWPQSTLQALGRSGGGSGAREPSEAAVDALRLLREAEPHLGPIAIWLLRRCVVEDAHWTATARTLHVNRETARDWTVTAIKAFALWLEAYNR